MKKRIFSLILILSMLLTMLAFTSCSDSNKEASDLENEEDRNNMSIDFWVPCYDGTTEEAKTLVSDALNAISQNKYSTHIEFHFIPSSQYEETIANHMAEVERAKEEAEETVETETPEGEEEETTAVETVLDEYGIPAIVYPSILPFQMDVFLVRDFNQYQELADEFLLMDLDAALTEGDAKRLKTCIYPTFLECAKIDDTLYGVPNNTLIGEYTALLISKDAISTLNGQGYAFDASTMTSPMACIPFIDAVGTKMKNLTPVNAEFQYNGLHFWNQAGNDKDFSLLVSALDADDSYGDPITVENVFDCPEFTDTFYVNKYLKEKKYVGNGNVAYGNYAIGTVTGTVEELAQYEDKYYINIISNPFATPENSCNSLFCISTYTRDLTRSLEIITMLNTNETFRTILQYGVEGVHWKYSDDKSTIVKLSDSYKMQLSETGNAYLTFPDYDTPKTLWKDWQKQNLDSVVDPFFSFDGSVSGIISSINADITASNKSITTKQSQIKEIQAQIDAFDSKVNTSDELQTWKNNLQAAQRSITSSQQAIEESKNLLTMFNSLNTLSQTYWNKINAMSASEFRSSVDTLRKEVAFQSIIRYSLSIDTFNDYIKTTDYRIVDGTVYYKLEDNEFVVGRNLIINTLISSYDFDLYVVEEKDCTYSLNDMLKNYVSEISK